MLKRSHINRFLALLALVLVGVMGATSLYAEELTGTDYKIEGATLSGGDLGESSSYALVSTLEQLGGDPFLQSSLYELKPGSTQTFTANVPLVGCFEATTDGTSQCVTGPSYLNLSGMVRVCGPYGCYDRARFEIEPENNPTDTLYGVQISTDNFNSDIRQVDGITLKPKALASRSIVDYKTKSSWESTSTNLHNLLSGVTYSIRISALHGNFTESSFSPVKSVATGVPTVEFDVDIADVDGVAVENSAPYSINFAGDNALLAGGGVNTADNLVWIDIVTNALGGASIMQKGLNGGLYSTLGDYLIASVIDDLGIVDEGIGLQNYDYSGVEEYSINYLGSGSGELGTITAASAYEPTSLHKVGNIDTLFNTIYTANGPLDTGRTAMYVKAKASLDAVAGDDYSESLTIVIVPVY